jgi:hypothetical protein
MENNPGWEVFLGTPTTSTILKISLWEALSSCWEAAALSYTDCLWQPSIMYRKERAASRAGLPLCNGKTHNKFPALLGVNR